MRTSKKERVRQKFNGLCAYSGTPLEDDWEMDHKDPVIRDLFTGKPMFPELDNEENLVPCQKEINRYKSALQLETFRTWLMAGLHVRISKLPKDPYTDSSIRRKARMLKIASYFGITSTQPFSGKFYFEQITQ